MDKNQLRALYDLDQRKGIEYPDMRREVTPDVVRFIDKFEPGDGVIIYSQLNVSNAGEAIREQVSYFESIGQDFEWKLYDYDQPIDLKERLAAAGFVVGEAEAIMALDLETAPEVLWQPAGCEVVRINNAAKLEDVLAVEKQVWDHDVSSLGGYLARALSTSPEQMSVYAAYVNGQPASAAWIYFPKHSQFASLWGGSTVSAYRRLGLYTALLAVRAQEARARQVKYLTVDASPMSRPILEKFGFEMIATSYPCQWKARAKE